MFNQRYSKSSLKTKALADTANGFSTPSPEEASLLKPIGAEDIIGAMATGDVNWPGNPMAIVGQEVKLHEQPSDLGGRLKDTFIAELKDPNTTIGVTLEYFGKRIEHFGIIEKYNRYNDYAQRGAIRVMDNIGDKGKAIAMNQRYTALAGKYGFYAEGAEFIKGASRLMLPVEIGQAGLNVLQAESGSKLQTAFEETGRIVGGGLGVSLGILSGIAGEISMPIISTPLVITGMVVETSAGAALGKEFGHQLYIAEQYVEEIVENDLNIRIKR